MDAVKSKLRKIAMILRNKDVIIIAANKNAIVVDASNQNPERVKYIATSFFKEAYKIN